MNTSGEKITGIGRVVGVLAIFLAIALGYEAFRYLNRTNVTQASVDAAATAPTVAPAPAPVESAPAVASSEEPQIAPVPDSPDTSESFPETGSDESLSPRNCYSMPELADLGEETPATRKQYADDINKAGVAEGLAVRTWGSDRQYLGFATSRRGEAHLLYIESLIKKPASMASLCSRGFAQIQFLVFDDATHYETIAEINTDYDRAEYWYKYHPSH